MTNLRFDRRLALVTGIGLTIAGLAWAQTPQPGTGAGTGSPSGPAPKRRPAAAAERPVEAPPPQNPGQRLPAPGGLPERDQVSQGFQVARLRYGGGGDWYSNPSSLPNLARAVGERTTVARRDLRGAPDRARR